VKFRNEFVIKNGTCIRTVSLLDYENIRLVLMLYKTLWSCVTENFRYIFFIYFSSRILFGGGLKNVEQRKKQYDKIMFQIWSVKHNKYRQQKAWVWLFRAENEITALPFRFRCWQCCRLHLLHEIRQTRVSTGNIIHKGYHLGCDVK